jgi:phosphatidate cytidylyltransferase
VLGLCVRQFVSKSNTAGILAISTTLFGLMYVPWLLNFIQKINFLPRHQRQRKILRALLHSRDEVQRYGRVCHRVIDREAQDDSADQPGEDVGGFGGAIVVATGASLVFAHLFADKMPGMTWLHAVILGVILSSTAVVGDLIESLFKREAGVKDSGNFFPGIGGILDLLDSLLFNAPIMYLYLRYALNHP